MFWTLLRPSRSLILKGSLPKRRVLKVSFLSGLDYTKLTTFSDKAVSYDFQQKYTKSLKEILLFWQAVAKAQEHSSGAVDASTVDLIHSLNDSIAHPLSHDVIERIEQGGEPYVQDDSGVGTLAPTKNALVRPDDMPEYIFIQSNSTMFYLSHWGKGLTIDRKEAIPECAWRVVKVDDSSFKLEDSRERYIDMAQTVTGDKWVSGFGADVDEKNASTFQCYRMGPGDDNFHGFVITQTGSSSKNAIASESIWENVSYYWGRKLNIAMDSTHPSARLIVRAAVAQRLGAVRLTNFKHGATERGPGAPRTKESSGMVTNYNVEAAVVTKELEVTVEKTMALSKSTGWSNEIMAKVSGEIPKTPINVELSSTTTKSGEEKKEDSTKETFRIKLSIPVPVSARSQVSVTLEGIEEEMVTKYSCTEEVTFINGGTGSWSTKGELLDTRIRSRVVLGKSERL